MVPTPSEASARAKMRGLKVTGDLFGRSHRFSHNERTVTVKLPEVRLGPDHEPLPEYSKLASRSGSIVGDGRVERMSFNIAWLEITVEVAEAISLPAELFEVSPKSPELAGPELTKNLDKLMIEYEARIASAILCWEQTTRWLSGSSSLGTGDLIGGREAAERLEFTAFQRTSDGRTFWLPSHTFVVRRMATIDSFLWDQIGSALSNGQSAPIWFRYLDEANHREYRRDLEGAILSGAIACETLAREVFWIKSGATQDAEARKLIDRLRASDILGKWSRLTGLCNEITKVKSVKRVFELRNRIMHAGSNGELDTETGAKELLVAVREFVNSGDKWYYDKCQMPNPRLVVAQHRAADPKQIFS